MDVILCPIIVVLVIAILGGMYVVIRLAKDVIDEIKRNW